MQKKANNFSPLLLTVQQLPGQSKERFALDNSTKNAQRFQ